VTEASVAAARVSLAQAGLQEEGAVPTKKYQIEEK
jgi:hypothetical protein